MAKSDDINKRLSVAREQLQERQRIVDETHQRYAKFGARVVQVILRYANRTNGLHEIATKLGLGRVAGSAPQIHEVVLRCLNEQGVDRFLTMVDPSHATQTSQSEPDATAAAAGPSKELVYTDRRSGKERRSGIDRRATTELLLWKNKRFGGERRQIVQRQRQLPPPWPKT